MGDEIDVVVGDTDHRERRGRATRGYTDPAGRRYYRYVSTLTGSVPTAVNGTITMPTISWTSDCSPNISSTTYVNGRGAATINGVQQVQVGVYRTI